MGKANFYWDFDEYYMPHHKTTSATDAGHYISMYLEHFPNELDTRSKEIYANMRQPKHISYISAATENIQARYVSQWLRNDNRYKDGRHTAVVMCDENILLPVMHSLPNEADKVNITSGFPLGMTPVASLISLLFDLYTTGAMQHSRRYRTQYVDKVLAHPYAQYIADCIPLSPMGKIDNITLLQQIGTLIKHVGVKAKDESDALFQESIFRMYTIINRLEQLAASGDMDVDVTTLRRLTKQLITTTTIPFHGEPVVGIQIMGVLETRNLDFNHVLLLSCNEGNMPKSVNDSSFIPYSIRKAHGLTTIDNKVAIYSYYFHRLLQRAQDVTIVYNNTTDNGHTGEMSRFMLQLMVDGTHNIKHLNLLAQNVPTTMCSKAIVKDEKIQQELDQMKNISPSAINVYIRCPLAFFYQYVARIKEPDCEDDTVDNRMFGNIFHKAAQFIYEDVTSRHATVEKTQLQKYLKDEKMLETVVDRAFNEELFKLSASEAANRKRATEYNGLQIINRKVIIEYLQQLLKIDQRLAPFTVLGLEKNVYNDIVFNTEDGAQRKIKIGGIIDRLDMVTDPTTGKPTIRVVDYKTGSPIKSVIKSIDEVFEGNSYKHSDYYLQTFLYSLIINNSNKLNPSKYNVSPALLFIKQASADNYDPVLCIDEHKVTDIGIYKTEYLKLLKEKLGEIFSKQKPFVPTNDKRTCKMCAFRMICGI